jgi:hypothetical protein
MAGLRRRYRVLDLEGLAEDVDSTCQDLWSVREAVFRYAAQFEKQALRPFSGRFPTASGSFAAM